VLSELFRAMNTKIEDRAAANIRSWANVFPFVNGGLFSESVDVPRFTKIARSYLLHVGGLDWTKINPDIFGSMIQAVADEEERGALGMHYTSVPNILKVHAQGAALLHDLRAKLEEASDNSRKLLNLRQRMARIRVFDHEEIAGAAGGIEDADAGHALTQVQQLAGIVAGFFQLGAQVVEEERVEHLEDVRHAGVVHAQGAA